MQLHHNNYYHLYNRSNNREAVFRCHDNYLYFLKKYRTAFVDKFDTIAYCLMPTHFHLLVRVTSENMLGLQRSFGKLLSSYTQGFNKKYGRNGSLFQQNSCAKHIDNENYLITLIAYIHQNPIRAQLVEKPEEWIYSSYQDYSGIRQGTLPKKDLINAYFATIGEFRKFSEQTMKTIEPKYWI
ncbi:MAG: transposase [Ignavibacteria bacterium]|nr:transposase [Ignavibacteria bacterium]